MKANHYTKELICYSRKCVEEDVERMLKDVLTWGKAIDEKTGVIKRSDKIYDWKTLGGSITFDIKDDKDKSLIQAYCEYWERYRENTLRAFREHIFGTNIQGEDTMRYLILYHGENSFEIVNSKEELEEELDGINEDAMSSDLIKVYEFDLKPCSLKVKSRPTWTI